MKRILAIDFGASNGRAILSDIKDGKISMEVIHRFPNDPVSVNGTLYWDIRIQGKWLSDTGFEPGTAMNVVCEAGKLIIETIK